MANITSEAGVSMGIVSLHFQSKEKLLVETLRTVADEYLNGWRTITGAETGLLSRMTPAFAFRNCRVKWRQVSPSMIGNRLEDFISRSDRFDRMLVTPGNLRRVFSTKAL